MTDIPVVPPEEKEKKKRKWLLLLLLLLLIGVATGVYFFVHNRSATTPVQVVAGDYLPDVKDAQKMTDKELKAAEQKAVDASKFNMVIKSEVAFATPDSVGDLYIQNPVTNAYPINVVIRLDETDEVIYTSGAIEPGYEVNGASLEKHLAKGEYAATATFNIYDQATKKKQGQVQAGLTIYIQND